MTVRGTMIQPTGGEIERVVDTWIDFREMDCGYYNGAKEDDEDQCRHPKARSCGTGSWCSMEECPLLKEAMRRKGVHE